MSLTLKSKDPQKIIQHVYYCLGKESIPYQDLVFFMAYEFLTFSAMETGLIKRPQLHHIHLFYVKICGVFWVVIDGAAAFLGYKILRFLKANEWRC